MHLSKGSLILGAFWLTFMLGGCGDGEKKSSAPRTDQVNSDHRDTQHRRDEVPITNECDGAWQKFANGVKVGLTKSYEATSATNGGALGSINTKRTWREVVTGVKPNEISVERVERNILPTETPEKKVASTLTRDDQCRAMVSDANETAPKMEVLAERGEKVTTAAGNFDTKYAKIKQSGTEDGTEYEFISETWTIEGAPEILVKSITQWKTKMNGKPYEQTASLELTELKLP